GRTATRQRRAVFDWAHWGLGIVVVRARIIWISAAVYGEAAGQSADRHADQWLSRIVGEQADLQERVRAVDAEDFARGRDGGDSGGSEHHAGRGDVRGFFRDVGVYDDWNCASGFAYGCG